MFSCPAHGNTPEQPYLHPTWLKLIHYENSSSTKYISTIHSDNFFLSAQGKTNPESEFNATIQAMNEPAVGDLDEHTQCLFPARFMWLKKIYPELVVSSPVINCLEFKAWNNNSETKSLSVVFATGFLGNPASYYGHTLLKFNTRNENVSALQDISVNYGAIDTDGDNPLSYIFKGLFGGYNAGFTHINYYYHNHNYGENELRNIWEYRLSFDEEATRFVVAHAWEVLGKKYTYYFLNKNCGYRMAELLEIVEGVDVLPDRSLWLIPQSLIQTIASSSINNRPLIDEVIYTPSRQSRLHDKYKTLSPTERQMIEKIINEPLVLKEQEFTQWPLARQQLMLDTAMDYHIFIKAKDASKAESSNDTYQQVLIKRYSLPPGTDKKKRKIPPNPSNGRAPSLIKASVIENSVYGGAIDLTLRPAYYDELDAGSGHIKGSALSMMEATFRYDHDRLRLKELNAIDIKSVNPYSTGLPNDDNSSWRLNAGYKSPYLACVEDCLSLGLQTDYGFSWNYGQSSLFTAYAGSRIQDNRQDSGNLILSTKAAFISSFTSNISYGLEYTYSEPINGELDYSNSFDFIGRYRLGTDLEIRLSFSRDSEYESSLTIGYYW